RARADWIRISLTIIDWRQHPEFLAPPRNPLSSFHLSDTGRKAGKDQPVFLFLRVILGVELRGLRACPAGNGWHREIEGLLFHQQRLCNHGFEEDRLIDINLPLQKILFTNSPNVTQDSRQTLNSKLAIGTLNFRFFANPSSPSLAD